jgi:hypothetical protein
MPEYAWGTSTPVGANGLFVERNRRLWRKQREGSFSDYRRARAGAC